MKNKNSYDFSTKGAFLGVKELILRFLYHKIPFEDTFQYIFNSSTNEIFWERVDSLPLNISLEAHKIELEIENNDKDFTDQSISPNLFEFFEAKCLSQSSETLGANEMAFLSTNNNIINNFLSKESNWTFNEITKIWVFEKNEFQLDLLINLCDCFISNGKTYLICPYNDLRINYLEIEKLLINKNENYNIIKLPIINKMKNFHYLKSNDFKLDLIHILDESEINLIPNFELNSIIINNLINLMNNVKNYLLNNPQPSPHFPINEITLMRTESLITQMSLPLPQRNAFSLTPQMINARLGDFLNDNPYEIGSIAELLFCDAIGEPVTLPFQSSKIEIPTNSSEPIFKSIFRRFISMELIDQGFNNISESSLEIIVDSFHEVIKSLVHTAKPLIQNNNVDQKNAFRNALLSSGYYIKPFL